MSSWILVFIFFHFFVVLNQDLWSSIRWPKFVYLDVFIWCVILKSPLWLFTHRSMNWLPGINEKWLVRIKFVIYFILQIYFLFTLIVLSNQLIIWFSKGPIYHFILITLIILILIMRSFYLIWLLYLMFIVRIILKCANSYFIILFISKRIVPLTRLILLTALKIKALRLTIYRIEWH